MKALPLGHDQTTALDANGSSSFCNTTGSLTLTVAEPRVTADQHIRELADARKQLAAATLQLVAISDIVSGTETLRHDCDLEADEQLQEAFAEGSANIPPIVVRQEGNHLIIIDGHRRLAAAQRAGIATIAALVITCSASCGLALALSLNAHHGCRLSRFEILNFIVTLFFALPGVLTALTSRKTSLRKLAQTWGVSKDTIHRAAERARATSQPTSPADSAPAPSSDQSKPEAATDREATDRDTATKEPQRRPKSARGCEERSGRPKKPTSRCKPKLRSLGRELVRLTDTIAEKVEIAPADVYLYVTTKLLVRPLKSPAENAQPAMAHEKEVTK